MTGWRKCPECGDVFDLPDKYKTCSRKCGNKLGGKARTKPLRDRLLAGVRIDSAGCWIWQKSILKSGYGCMRVGGRTRTAHSVAYELFVGQVPDGWHIDHRCRVRECCNPDHLEAVTPLENARRALPYRAVVTHCPRGHEYTPENTYKWRRRKHCRECQRAAGRAYQAKRYRARRQREGREVAA